MYGCSVNANTAELETTAEAQDGFVLKVTASGTVVFNKRFAAGNQKWDGMLATGW